MTRYSRPCLGSVGEERVRVWGGYDVIRPRDPARSNDRRPFLPSAYPEQRHRNTTNSHTHTHIHTFTHTDTDAGRIHRERHASEECAIANDRRAQEKSVGVVWRWVCVHAKLIDTDLRQCTCTAVEARLTHPSFYSLHRLHMRQPPVERNSASSPKQFPTRTDTGRGTASRSTRAWSSRMRCTPRTTSSIATRGTA